MPHLKDSHSLSFPVEKVFAVALDIKHYPGILSYVRSVRVLSDDGACVKGSITLGLSFIHFTYDCEIVYKKNDFIRVTSDQAVFKKFASKCIFQHAGDGRTIITYELDALFSNPMLELLAAAVLPHQAKATLRAFERYLAKA